MILYTKENPQMIFPPENTQEPKVETVGTCMVEARNGKLERLISTNPADYLDENLQIGQKL